jgi:hypothetical protein
MPENKNEKTVDIDTSGPGAEVELDVKQPESNDIEVSNDKDGTLSPLTLLRNLMSSLMLRQINKIQKTRTKEQKQSPKIQITRKN